MRITNMTELIRRGNLEIISGITKPLTYQTQTAKEEVS